MAVGVNMPRVLYSAGQLRRLQNSTIATMKLPSAVFTILRELNLCRRPPTRRLYCGGYTTRSCTFHPKSIHDLGHVGTIPVVVGRRRRPSLIGMSTRTNSTSPILSRNNANLVVIKQDKMETPRVCQLLNVSTLNARSICNKSADILEVFNERNVDVMAITETWLKSKDTVTPSNLTSQGHKFVHNCRINKSGGGVGLLYKPDVNLRIPSIRFATTSFEYMECEILCSRKTVRLFVLYRPPASSITLFLTEFSTLIESMLSSPTEFVVMGDFNTL